MWETLKNLYLEIRPNAVWDLVKYMLIAGVSLLFLQGYRFLVYLRELPQDRVVDIMIFVGAFILITGAAALARYRDKQLRGASAQVRDVKEAVDLRIRVAGPASALSSERIFPDVTPDYLTGLFKKHTSFQATKLVDPYVGKWMKVSGFVTDVSSDSSYATVKIIPMMEPPADFHVIAYFRDQKWIDHTLILRCGDKVSVLGQISRVGKSKLLLEHCETMN